MGAWGLDSYSNDNTFNHLKCENSDKPKTNEIENSLKEVLSLTKNKNYDKKYVSETYLGILLLGLKNKCQISESYLKKGISKAKELIQSKEYLENWSENEKGQTRKEILEFELQTIKKHIQITNNKKLVKTTICNITD